MYGVVGLRNLTPKVKTPNQKPKPKTNPRLPDYRQAR